MLDSKASYILLLDFNVVMEYHDVTFTVDMEYSNYQNIKLTSFQVDKWCLETRFQTLTYVHAICLRKLWYVLKFQVYYLVSRT